MSKPSASRRICASCVVAVVATVAVALLAFSPARLRAAFAGSSSLVSHSKTVPPSARDHVKASFASLPLGFEPNYGQTDPQVKYMAHANGYTLFLTNHDAVFAFHPKSSSSERSTGHGPLALPAQNTHDQPNSQAVVRMQLVGGNSNAIVAASDQLPGKSNYIRGKDPRNWHTDVSHYSRVSYRNIYPGINLAYHGERSKLEFDFIVAPESNPAPIDLAFNGAQQLAIDASGNLIVSSGAGDVVLHKPVAYQQQSGTHQPVDARFVLKADNQVHFELGSYDRSRELIIDPTVTVTYATYLGGNTEDDAYAIAFDSTGAAYVTGQTNSSNFPKQGGLPGNTLGLNFAVFVTKLAANGQTLAYSTYVDGGGSDTGTSSGNAIAVDASGNAFVAGGTTSTTLPATAGAFQNSNAGGLDAFVFELNPAGNALTSLTYLGGMGGDVANGIAVDGSGNVYLVGATTSSDFPTANPIQTSLVSTSDAFVTKLNPALSTLVYSTYLGGGPADFASAVALDSSNNAYVTGGTGSNTFPTTLGAFQTVCNSCTGTLYNAFITVINFAGSTYNYSTYLGGSNNDEGLGIAVDSSGDAYVTGQTNSSTTFPLKSAFQSTYGGDPSDAFVSELNPSGSALVYSTFLGGSANDVGTSIAVDQGGNAYVTGQTGSTNFPTANPTQSTLNKNGLAGDNDAFVSELNSAGSQLIFSTFLGGALDENTPAGGGSGALGGIAVDAKGDSFYVTGNTASTDFPFTPLAYQTTNRGVDPPKVNAFVANYSQQAFTVSASALTPPSVTPAGSATSTVTIAAVNGFTGSVDLSCAVSGPSNAVSPPTCIFGTNPVLGGSGSSSLTVSTTLTTSGGVYAITVIGTGPSGMTHSVTVDLTVNAANFKISATPPTPVAPGGTAMSTVTLTSFDSYAFPVNLSCSVAGTGSPLPACSVTGTTPLTPTSGGATSTVTITTTAPGAAMIRPRKFFYALWLPVVGLSLLGFGFKTSRSQRKKLLGFLLVGIVMTGLILLPSCGGSSSNGGGGGGGSCAAAPNAPTSLAASSITMTGATLTWTAATAGANCSVTGYTIYDQNGNSAGTTSGTTFTLTGLSPLTNYSYTVAATDSAGTSQKSSPASFTTLTAGTPAATYTITITGTGTDPNTITHSTTVNLTVN